MRAGLARPLERAAGTLPPDYPGDPGPPLRRDYLDRLAELHARLRPTVYLEIGVFAGRSLSLAGPGTLAIGVDPAPDLAVPLGPLTRIFAETSCDFFARDALGPLLGGRPVEMVFIDGLHLFEYALRDLAHALRYCAPDACILLHDTLPPSAAMAARTRRSSAWTGDVWKVVPALRRHWPAIDMVTIDTPPSGLTLIRGVGGLRGTLEDAYDALVEAFIDLDFAWFEAQGRPLAAPLPDGPEVIARLFP
jgi:hypothetical protein